jgi:hypothetical protein
MEAELREAQAFEGTCIGGAPNMLVALEEDLAAVGRDRWRDAEEWKRADPPACRVDKGDPGSDVGDDCVAMRRPGHSPVCRVQVIDRLDPRQLAVAGPVGADELHGFGWQPDCNAPQWSHAAECELLPVGRPHGRELVIRRSRHPPQVPPGTVDDVDVEVLSAPAAVACEGDPVTVGRPGRISISAVTRRTPDPSGSVIQTAELPSVKAM